VDLSIAPLKHAFNKHAIMLPGLLATVPGMPKPSTFQDRIKAAMDLAVRSASQVARVLRSPDGTIGVSPQAVHQALRGETKSFTAENTARAARYLKVDYFWFATGEGTPRPSKTEEAPIEQVVYRLGVLLGELDDLARGAAANLLAQLAQRPDDAQRIAGLIKALAAGEPSFTPPALPVPAQKRTAPEKPHSHS
jgi:hypothetical protein